ncbi:type IV pilin protein [Alteromonas oceanisediminis]|uniref:type IV pilin protein n=1 Tax=Alteromonas oceanisediminis TaxID=2836180 RepID=UPI001BDAC4D1|nr:type IV pilin protein [Alteromonas oceanisediminis]MBT0585786.1 type IV pilin protein [Alteromonas oceanisediminis]
MSKTSQNAVSGFTLIELMIVVAIVGIITAIAYPSYQGMIKSSHRSTAQADLMAFAAAMERHKAANFTYEGAAQGGGDTGKPAIFQSHSPASEPAVNKRYDLTIDVVSANGVSYRLKASPASGTEQVGDGNLFVFSDGRKAWDKDGSGSLSSAEYCWNC